ncbi:hypothetical protein appser6_14270 [Actinobacillus pleuropneumoniae serovar 6 str. Femo]|uniref:Uncharacterized protein n=1 Tax=Actinobacillus pleuropneumoniae serovar 6 str. Femo TaxID=754256 RepID=A0A828Q4K6_ACTPL|nr:hypothetical protein appser6_14270 [Actinobacillus pleuropneumoniae serovar 6 str. Femo]
MPVVSVSSTTCLTIGCSLILLPNQKMQAVEFQGKFANFHQNPTAYSSITSQYVYI